MSEVDKEKVREILSNDDELEYLARQTGLPVQTLQMLFEVISDRPELTDHAREYIQSPERSEDFKSFMAGENKGEVKGHERGLLKGGLLGLAVAASVYLMSRR